MAAILIKDKVSEDDLKMAREDYGDFIKIVVDIETGTITIGGQWHVDGEQLLLEAGGRQQDLWGGGVDLISHEISYSAMTNIKPGVNTAHIILDSKTRELFDRIVKEKLSYE